MNIAFISDLHFKLYKKNNSFLPFVITAVENFEKLCLEHRPDLVIITGDVFHLKDTVSIEAQHYALKSLRSIMDQFETYVIPGNHDILSKNNAEIHGLQIFQKDCTLYSDYGFKDFGELRIHFLPYFNDEIIIQKLKEITLGPSKNILCTHLGLRGFDLDNGHEDVFSELDLESFKSLSFDKVFSGHYHSHQTRGNWTYISSPLESHWGDEGLHGYTFWNSNTDEITFYENLDSPHFVSIELNAKNLDYLNNIEKSFIKLIIKKVIDNNLLLKYKEKLLKKNYEVLFEWDLHSVSNKIAVAKEWSIAINSEPTELLKSYLSETELSHSKEELLTYLEIK
jgi:DNA repair exonuclease SbcCD nuclease subunit